MMMRGPFRELIPVAAKVSVKIPQGTKADEVHLLVSGQKPSFEINEDKVILTVQQIHDHEIVAIDLP
jgi:hypothetical protein